MRVKNIHLKNFKRFTDLLIRDIPETAKLVVVVGPNGCGKSSLFDAFLHWYRVKAKFGHNPDDSYYLKDPNSLGVHAKNQWVQVAPVDVTTHENTPPNRQSLYVRTAYRNDPDFNITGINRPNAPSENVRLQRFIENDQTVSDNYQRLVYSTMAGVYDTDNDSKTVQGLREELIGQIRTSMKNVFGDLLLNNISDPLGSGAFFFEKGTSKSYHYKNLSGGEKAAFDLILDLHIKKQYFPDAIYCIDESETHLHTRVQGALLREMVNIIPDPCQLWVTTHSLGVLRAAQELEATTPGSVCVIDFDGVDPDVPAQLFPASLGRVSWDKMLSIALDDLSRQIAPEFVVVCEGSSVGSRRKDFDAEIYNRIFGPHIHGVLFISGGSSTEIAANGFSVGKSLCQILPSTKVVALADRDDKSDSEVTGWEASGDIVLPKRNLEAFLFADDVLEKIAETPDLFEQAKQIKADAVAASVERGNPPDDLKSAAGEIYVNLKRALNIQRAGNNTDAFMRDTLAPLIGPGMDTYEEMKAGIIDRLKGSESV